MAELPVTIQLPTREGHVFLTPSIFPKTSGEPNWPITRAPARNSAPVDLSTDSKPNGPRRRTIYLSFVTQLII